LIIIIHYIFINTIDYFADKFYNLAHKNLFGDAIMDNYFSKECFDSNPHFKIHHTIEQGEKHTNPAHLHYDNSYILTYFKRGSGNIRIEGVYYEISEGDIVLINPSELHLCKIDGDAYHERLAIYISPSLFDIFQIDPMDFLNIFHSENHKIITRETAEENRLYDFFERAYATVKQQNSKAEACTQCILTELIYTLGEVCPPQKQKNNPAAEDPLIKAVLKYLNDNFRDNVTLKTLEDKFFVSKYHLSRRFKETVGTSIMDYLIYKRLLNFNMLVRNGTDISEAAYSSGFRNYSNFFKLYKKHMGISPQAYRQECKK